MKTTMDRAGRIVIPRAIRSAAGLDNGGEVEIDERNGIIEIKPVYAKTRIVMHGKIATIEYEDDVPPLTLEQVNAIRDELRNRRR